MISTVELEKFARDLDKASREVPKAAKQFLQNVADEHFKNLAAAAPPDDEGRLRASLERRTTEHGKEYIEKYKKDSVEVGSTVYYAPMVNDGHIMGKRLGNRGHRKTDAKDRRDAAKSAGRAWVAGRFFREEAENATEAALPAMAEAFTDEALREVMG